MTPEEARKLLGGYATGTLSTDERKALFAAALEDQTLFDALAGDEALRELLDDPPSRAELVAALGEEKLSLGAQLAAWWKQPQSLAWAGGAAAVVLAAVIVYQMGTPPAQTEVAVVAKVSTEEIAEEPAVPPPPSASPQPAVKPLPPPQSRADVPAAAPEQEAAGQVREADSVEEARSELAMADALRQEENRSDVMATGDVGVTEAPAPQAMAFSTAPSEPAPQAATPPPPVRITNEAQRRTSTTQTSAVSASEQQLAQLVAARNAIASVGYTVERSDADGNWTALPGGSAVRLSDAIRLRIRAVQSGTLVVADTTSNEAVWSGEVEQGSSYVVPLPAPESPGTRRLALRYAAAPAGMGGGSGAPAGFRMGEAGGAAPDTVITIVYESQ